ncbi:MAG: MBL fold metallo-hydrolase [Burkholderiaceae bacterium]|nr:MBL fold metallo-hydrolase [Burkholderiaceae bacterium]
MRAETPPTSFAPDESATLTMPAGQRAHRDMIAHLPQFERRMHVVCDGVWVLVGNGLSNQCFVRGPEGLIAIDTGECVEEMRSALASLREYTSDPVVAVIYTHFHYVSGTRAIFDAGGDPAMPIWAHSLVAANRLRVAGETSVVASRGLVEQFGLGLPADGPDGLVGVGLGTSYRNPDHAPYTPGYVTPNHCFDAPTRARIAGLDVVMTPAPSDADDSITIWFPALGLCVNNLVWPSLFNIFPIRGEAFRDPRVLLEGIDHILGLAPEHLVTAHGLPISSRERVREIATDSRDAIQFLWDQTVRLMNQGFSGPEIAMRVRLPARFSSHCHTRELYGLAEHYVRQIQCGLVGWYDGEIARLFPLPPTQRARRLIAGFGGIDTVLSQARAALDAGDLRWALELASWLVRDAIGDGPAEALVPDSADEPARKTLAAALRAIAVRTTAANIRNWCLTHARALEGTLDLSRFYVHRFRAADVLEGPAHAHVHVLRVLLDPVRAEGVDGELRWAFDSGEQTGLRLRGQVAVPTDGQGADIEIRLSRQTWAQMLAGRLRLDQALSSGAITTDDAAAVRRWLSCFEHRAFEPGH